LKGWDILKIVLSQRIDIKSDYDDKLYNTYNFPARYKNQIHTGDVFIYYQGDRHLKNHRYYYGCGIIGKITAVKDENYYAELISCKTFERKVPIYLPEGGYFEQLGYESIRSRKNPPWQCSIRSLSNEAYDYIIKASGSLKALSM
jgi:hypothetical protein